MLPRQTSGICPSPGGLRVIKAVAPVWGARCRQSPGPGTRSRPHCCSVRSEQSAERRPEQKQAPMEPLSTKDRHMARLYVAGCFHQWEQLPDIARELIASGCSAEELRGCVRHLVVFAGYAPCLAATLTLHKAKLLPEDTPAKAGGPPGNAFELVYDGVTDLVRKKMHAADPALGEWIRMHLYGDVYSSPGLDLRQKQLLACSFLGVACMPDQLFGHALAALRFGNSKAGVQEAVRLGFQAARVSAEGAKEEALRMVDMAFAKYCKDFSHESSPPMISIPDPRSIRIPPLPPPVNGPSPKAAGGGGAVEDDAVVTVVSGSSSGRSKAGGGADAASKGLGRSSLSADGEWGQGEGDEGIVFAWEEIDPRFDKAMRQWKV